MIVDAYIILKRYSIPNAHLALSFQEKQVIDASIV